MAAASPPTETAAGAARVGLLYDERMCAHATPDGEDHPENPERLRAIWRKLNDEGVVDRCVVLKAKEAEDKHIASVHSQNHINLIKKISSKNYNSNRNKIAKKFNSIYFNKGSSESALLAAGSVLEVAEKVAAGELSSAIALVRPPGHHAEHDKAMGFCLFNNVAVAANYLLNERTDLGIKKILIVDWDVHHGNATQKMFYDDPRVLSFSVHRFDYGNFYPYEADGSHSFIGDEAGTGYNINVPWEHGKCGDADYIAAWDHVLLPVTEAFDPDIVLVSAGFDAALGDPLGGCCVTPNGYALLLTKLLRFAKGRIVMALEGGYNLSSMANSVFACAKVLLGDKFTFNSPAMQPFESTLRVIQAVRNELKTCWPVLNNNLSETVSMTRPSPSEVHCAMLGLSSHKWPILEETKVRCKRKRGSNTSLPATLECSLAYFKKCNPTDKRRSQRTMKAIHRQMTRSVAEDEELTHADDPMQIREQVEDSEKIIDDFEVDDGKTNLYPSLDLLGCHLQGTLEERRFLCGVSRRICTPEMEMLLSQSTVDELADDLEVSGMRSILYARALKRRSREVETELMDLLAQSEDALKVEKAEVVDLKKRNVSLVKELEEAKEGLKKERAASKKNRDELEDIVRRSGELETELKDLLAQSEDALKVEKAEVVDLKKRNVSLVKELEEAKEGLKKERTASKKNRDDLEDIVSDLQTQLKQAVQALEVAKQERQKAETWANVNSARVVRMGKELRDCMGAAKVALDSVWTGVGLRESVALLKANVKALAKVKAQRKGIPSEAATVAARATKSTAAVAVTAGGRALALEYAARAKVKAQRKGIPTEAATVAPGTSSAAVVVVGAGADRPVGNKGSVGKAANEATQAEISTIAFHKWPQRSNQILEQLKAQRKGIPSEAATVAARATKSTAAVAVTAGGRGAKVKAQRKGIPTEAATVAPGTSSAAVVVVGAGADRPVGDKGSVGKAANEATRAEISTIAFHKWLQRSNQFLEQLKAQRKGIPSEAATVAVPAPATSSTAAVDVGAGSDRSVGDDEEDSVGGGNATGADVEQPEQV